MLLWDLASKAACRIQKPVKAATSRAREPARILHEQRHELKLSHFVRLALPDPVRGAKRRAAAGSKRHTDRHVPE